MYYRAVENKRYDRTAKKESTASWELTWGVYLQDPGDTRTAGKIAGQDRKRFEDKSAMEKYLQGRIKAHAHLFTELSPPIPKESVQRFTVNGQLLPGYTVESEQEKQSILGQLAKAREQAQERFRKGDDFQTAAPFTAVGRGQILQGAMPRCVSSGGGKSRWNHGGERGGSAPFSICLQARRKARRLPLL